MNCGDCLYHLSCGLCVRLTRYVEADDPACEHFEDEEEESDEV